MRSRPARCLRWCGSQRGSDAEAAVRYGDLHGGDSRGHEVQLWGLCCLDRCGRLPHHRADICERFAVTTIPTQIRPVDRILMDVGVPLVPTSLWRIPATANLTSANSWNRAARRLSLGNRGETPLWLTGNSPSRQPPAREQFQKTLQASR